MGKTIYLDRIQRLEKLSRFEQEDLVDDLLSAFKIIQTFDEVALFVQDLLTKSEVKRLAKRLRIAKLLFQGNTYAEIEGKLHTSHTTVAKVATWLAEKGDGFRNIIKKLPTKKESSATTILKEEWDSLKRKYSIYLWPEILLEEIIKSASSRKKEKLKRVLDNLETKSELHKHLEKILTKSQKYTTT